MHGVSQQKCLGKIHMNSHTQVVLNYLNVLLSVNDNPIVYEIGIEHGITSLEISKTLDNRGEFHLFSYEDEVRNVLMLLHSHGFRNIFPHPNPRKTYSGYHFTLAENFNSLKKFDLVFLDGAHTLSFDGYTVAILKELCNVNGYIILDDLHWTLANSPTRNPTICPHTSINFDATQISTSHIKLINDTLLKNDKRFRSLGVVEDRIVIYKKEIN